MRWPLAAMLVLVALGPGAARSAAADEQPNLDLGRVRDIVQPSIVFIQTTYSAPVRDTNPRFRGLLFDGGRVSATFRCTGFFVNPDGYVATAGHCVLPDATSRAAIIGAAGEQAWRDGVFTRDTTLEQALAYAERWFAIAGEVTPAFLVSRQQSAAGVSRGQAVGARRVGYRVFDEGDVGLLKFEAKGVDMPGLELAAGNVEVGTPIVAVGFPGSVDEVTDADLNPSFKDGRVSAVKTRGGGEVRVYEHSAAVSGGMSGGPVVDGEGRVVGINSFGIVGETQAFNFSAPVEVLNEVLGDKDVANEVGEIGATYREGVAALYGEDRGKALDRFDEVLRATGNPAAVLASELRAEAEELPEDGFPWWIVLVVLLALGGLAVAVVARRRRRHGAFPPLAGHTDPTASPASRAAAAPSPAPATQLLADATAAALVVVTDDGSSGTRFALSGELVIGREHADILLEDEQVSRQHARIAANGRIVELTDTGSANGTFVNGVLLERTVALHAGDLVTVGSTQLRVEIPAPPSASGGATVTR